LLSGLRGACMLRKKGQKTFIFREGLNSLVLKSKAMLCASTQVRTIIGWTGLYLIKKVAEFVNHYG